MASIKCTKCSICSTDVVAAIQTEHSLCDSCFQAKKYKLSNEVESFSNRELILALMSLMCDPSNELKFLENVLNKLIQQR